MKPKDKIGALDQAMRLLSARPHSESEIRKKLAIREHAPDDIERAITRLLELKYLNDEELCARHAESRLAKTNLGPGKLRAELAGKGFAQNLIDKTLAALYSDRQMERDTALKAAVKKLKALKPGLAPEAIRAKIYAHLLRKGFDMEIARRVALDGLNDLMERE